MGKVIRKFILYLFLIFIVVIVAAMGAASLFEDQIGRELVKQINKTLKSELSVEKFDITVLSSFPEASATLRNIVLKDANNTGVLLEAEKMGFKFGLFSLFGSSIKVHSVVIENGALTIQIDENGKANYVVWQESEAESSGEDYDLGISLKEAKLIDIELIYQDIRAKQEMLWKVEEGVFAGEFSTKNFSMNSVATIKSHFVDLDGLRYFAGKNLAYDAHLIVNLEDGIYDLERVNVGIESNVFNLDGTIHNQGKYTDLDLVLTTEEGNIQSVLQLLPIEYQTKIQDFQSEGNFVFNAIINGPYGNNQNPAVDVTLTLNDGRITSPRLENPLKDVNLSAKFTNGSRQSNRTSILRVEQLSGYFERQLVEMTLLIQNLDDPEIDFQLDGILPLESVYGLIGSSSILEGDGEIEFKRLRINGRYQDMLQTQTIARVDASGELEFDDAALTINGEELIVDRGSIIMDDNLLNLDGIKIEGAGSEMVIDGRFANLIPVLFSDSLNSKEVALEFNAKLQADKLDLDRLVKTTDIAIESSEVEEQVLDSIAEESNERREFYTNFLKGAFDMDVENFNYNLIEGEDFVGKVIFNNNEMTIKGKTNAMEGVFNLNGTLYLEKEPHLEAALIADNINATEFFRQGENFGQEVLRSEHISGSLDTKMDIEAYWDKEGNFDYDKFHILAAIAAKEGELKDFDMLTSFSSYVKMRDLEHIKFVNMQNFFEIKDQKILIPAMFIQSNAMNMTLSGEHSFENDMDYCIKVNAGQIMANRFKKYNSGMEPQPSKRNGWFNLYFNIFGDLENYEVGTDKRKVKEVFDSSERHRETIRRSLADTFGSINFLKAPTDSDIVPEENVEFIEGFN